MARANRPDLTRPPSAGYVGFAVILTLVTMSCVINQYWNGDFWAHAAAVGELARRPDAPNHPMLAVDAPHPLFTPYSLALAWISRLTGASPQLVLGWAALPNLWLLLAGLFAITRAFAREKSEVFVVLAVLLAWGRQPWQFSGFLHLSALPLVLPYPSTFAIALTLLCGARVQRRIERPATFVALIVGVAVVILTHPAAAMFLALGFAATCLHGLVQREYAQVLTIVGIGVLSAGLPLLWPYYPFLDFSTVEAPAFAPFNAVMYDDVLWRTAPAWLGLPFLLARLSASRSDPLAWWFVAASGLYVLGGLTGQWGFGRILPLALLLSQVALGDAIAGIWKARPTLSRRRSRIVLATAGVVLAAGIVNLASGIVRAIPRALLPDQLRRDVRLEREVERHEVLVRGIPVGATTIAPLNWGYLAASAGAKLIGMDMHQAWIRDENERIRAVNEFYNCDTAPGARRQLLDTFHVTHIVIDLTRHSDCPHNLDELGVVVLDDGRTRIIRVGS